MEYVMSPVTMAPPPEGGILIHYAGFWRRFAAYILDALIMGFCLLPLRLALGIPFFSPWLHHHLATDLNSPEMHAYLWFDWCFVIIWWLYAANYGEFPIASDGWEAGDFGCGDRRERKPD